jgi:diacylglycerol kinase (ATP)
MDEVLIFANPISGRGRGRTAAALIGNELRRRGYGVRTFLSRPDQTSAIPDTPVRAAIVIGGDGTLRGVAQWAIDHATIACRSSICPADSCVPYPLLIVPTGSANLMGQHLGLKWRQDAMASQVADALQRPRIVNLDVARTRGGIFLLMAGVGFDAMVVHKLDAARRGPIGLADYLRISFGSLMGYAFPPLSVTVDGRCVFPPTPALVVVGNIREYGHGFPVLPYARGDDGLLDVCAMPCRSQAQLLSLFLSTASEEHLGREGTVYVKGRHIRVESDQTVPAQIDGDPGGSTPLEIDLLPGRIPFIVP